ncbi:adenine nucleotide alpha hydrolase family protein [Paraliomyxa miuraensis]|uniref:hypothetical protein n=1 Tax=Paraliomyxa miuraensis TaxID=376150 RepID=UPI00225C132A|nr:hypothetical protein [Paraliomyxa miuraensis]MCX4245695.1 hypothetical protein [Paraliomyxa miuraensis]
MAHILVYLQRTPGGLHPASAVALCRARDISSERGATLTAVCGGDAGALDRGIAQAAGSFGADVLVFGGPSGLAALQSQLNPVHVLVPWTEEGLAQAETLVGGPPVTRWLTTRQPAWGGADAVTAVLAGTLPWHAYNEMLEAEYQADVDEVNHPSWVGEVSAACAQDTAPVFAVGGRGPVKWLGSRSINPETQAALTRLGAEPASADEVVTSGTVLWLSADPVPPTLALRPVTVRLLVLPGEHAGLDPSWRAADWVLSGSRAAALGAILDSPWASLSG